jgi:peptide/nickel transport system ATP-binding protein
MGYDRGVQVVGLRCEIEETVLLDDVGLTVEFDAPLALLGPSGAGKSLALRCLLGLAPTVMRVTGRLVVNEEVVDLSRTTEVAARRGRGITLLPQASAASLDPVRTLGRQLSEVLAVHDNRADSPEALLSRVGLAGEFLQRYPLMLSGGQAQRAALALALACRPAVLLADEPTASLDNVGQAAMLAVLLEMCAERRISLVLVTHDVAVAACVCKTAVVLDRGRVVEAGRLDELLVGARHATTRGLIAAARRADGLWEAAHG